MQRYENAQKEIVDRTMNLLLQNSELSSKPLIYVDSFGDGRGVIGAIREDHPWTELIAYWGTPLTICKLLQLKKIARRVMKKKLFYGVSLYIRFLFQETWLRSTLTLKKLWK